MRTLKEMREMAGLSVRQAAERLNYCRYSVYQWEQGRHTPQLDACVKLAKLYKCTLDEVFEAIGIAGKQVSKLQELRERAGFSRNQVAERIHYDAGSIWAWEKGRRMPQLETLVKLAELYKCTFDEIANAVIKG